MAGRRESFAERRERRAAVDDPQVVLEAAGRFLEARSRSVAEVRRRLGRPAIGPTWSRARSPSCIEFGVLDDEAFARAWVESRDRARPRGERAIREELRLKGIDRATVDLVLAERREAAAEAGEDGSAVTPDRVAAERLLAKHRVPWRASPILVSVGSAPTRCWRGTGSIPRRAARWRRRSRRARQNRRPSIE